MSRPRFLADHDLNEHIIDGVLRREPSVEFLRARDVDMDDKSDGEVLAFASGQGLLVVSHDVNTMPLHTYTRMASGQAVAGVIMVQQSKPISAVIESLVLIWSASEAEEWRDQVVFLPW